MNITKGKVYSAQKIVIYGPEGIGKSTFASQFPNPLFIDTEGSTKKLDVSRFDKPSSWIMLNEQINYVISQPGICETLVIDTIDWAEQLCIEHICSKANKKGIEDFGYGNGYVYEKEEIGRFLNKLDEVIAHNIHVVLTAHAQIRKFEQPDEMGSYDRWELKLGKKTGSQISPLIKEWADSVFFATYETITVVNEETKKVKAQGGKRVMYTTHHVCWDAKNRDGLPDKLPFEFSAISNILDAPKSIDHGDFEEIIDNDPAPVKTPPHTESTAQKPIDSKIPKPLADLMIENNVTEETIRRVVAHEGYFPENMPVSEYPKDFVMGCLVGAWDQVYAAIKDFEDVPF